MKTKYLSNQNNLKNIKVFCLGDNEKLSLIFTKIFHIINQCLIVTFDFYVGPVGLTYLTLDQLFFFVWWSGGS